MRVLPLLVALAISVASARAHAGAGGFASGKNQAYFLEAPKGWVMDDRDALQENIGAVFHPAKADWPESGVIIYTDCGPKKRGVQSPSDAMRADVALFKEDGSAVHPLEMPSIKTRMGGLTGEVYYFGPDKRGQFNARAYFTYKDDILLCPHSARQCYLQKVTSRI
jgi:hypothetical protein